MTSPNSAPGTPGYNPAWYALTDIYWDPVAGSDANAGTVGLPVQTWAEIIRRYGSLGPIMNDGQNTTVHMLSAQPAGQDPVWFMPRFSGQGAFSLIATPAVVAGNFVSGAYTPLVQGAPGTLTQVAGMPAGAAAGLLLVNVTRGGSFAVIISVTGGVATTGAPTGPGTPAAWLTGDTYQIQAPLNLNWGAIHPFDFGLAGTVCSINYISVPAVTTPGTGAVLVDPRCNLTFLGCAFGPAVQTKTAGGTNAAVTFQGCYLAGVNRTYEGNVNFNASVAVNELIAQGTQITCTANTVFTHAGLVIILQNGAVVNCSTRGTYISGTIQIQNAAQLQLSAASGASIWGAPSIQVYPGCVAWVSVPVIWADALLTSGSLTFGASTTTGSAYTGSGVWVDGITITPANIDIGGAGGSGLVDVISGARYCNAA